MHQKGSLIISRIGVHKTYALFPSTSSQIYNKEKREQVKAIICNKSAMDSSTFLLEPVKPKIVHKLRVHTYNDKLSKYGL